MGALPPELTDSIIDYVYDDKKTLASCGRVCKSWVDRSLYHLWRRIVVDSTHETMKRLAFFLDIIRDSPASVKQIEHLELSLLDHTLSDGIIAQLPLMSRLTTLSLNHLTVQSVPHDVVLSYSLEKLTISHMTFETMLDWHRLVVAFPNLVELTLGAAIQLRVLNTGSATLPTSDFRLSLRRLDVDFADDYHPVTLYWLAHTVLLVEAEALCLKRLPPKLVWLDKLWRRCMPSVCTLEIDATEANGEPFSPTYTVPCVKVLVRIDLRDSAHLIDLTYATRLQSVTLHTLPRLFPFRIAVLFRAILPKLPAGARLGQFLIVLHASSENALAIRDLWLVLWRALFTPAYDSHFEVCPNIVIRAKYPFQWGSHLLAGLAPLQEFTPVRLEYSTCDGEIHQYRAEIQGQSSEDSS